MRIEAGRATSGHKPGPTAVKVESRMSGGYWNEHWNKSIECGSSDESRLGTRIYGGFRVLSRVPKGTKPTVSFPLESHSSLVQRARWDTTRKGVDRSADEALPHTPPGGKPPETPGPLSLASDFRSRGWRHPTASRWSAPKSGPKLEREKCT